MSIGRALDILKLSWATDHFRDNIQFKPCFILKKSQQAISVHQTPKQHEGQKTYSPRDSSSSWGLIWVGQSSRPRQFYKSGDRAYQQMSRNQSGCKCGQKQCGLISGVSGCKIKLRGIFLKRFYQLPIKSRLCFKLSIKRQREACRAICRRHRKSVQNRCRINSLNQLNPAAILKCKMRPLFQKVISTAVIIMYLHRNTHPLTLKTIQTLKGPFSWNGVPEAALLTAVDG